ncbi:PREDICTED: glycylpeptide N-tetradecanoyltransferase 1-like [Camelina sativa]|uniref:Glycylpeptide N-tetradecanoyltransferase n=1 Tax=Camelina sativa TaxID=90675 RepID=A0ABM0X1Y1_CAMSA|nr:PREDICTED: glycylpeptide N-tetradecanoyltransferase 1-like [Camelina sativa]
MSDPKPKPNPKEYTSGGSRTMTTHEFWETQPVVQLEDMGDTTLPEGPIQPPTLVSEVRQEPYNLREDYEWITCDMKSDDMCSEVYNFFKDHYAQKLNCNVHPSKEWLMWALCPPGYHQSWHVGVRDKATKKLVAFISGVPARIRVRDKVISMANINFLCIDTDLRSRRLAPILIMEVTRRVRLKNIWQAAYPSRDVVSRPVTTCQYWGRMLNPKKLIDAGYADLGERMKMSMAVKLYKVPDAPSTPGFREMGPFDVFGVTEFLRNYLSQFGIAACFDADDVEHWFLPREDVIHTYLVVSPETSEITDFCSFYTVPFTISDSDSRNPKNTTVQCAYSYYNVVTQTSLPKLMNDVLTVSKQKGVDIFYALDVMQNASFFTELKFRRSEGAHLHYHLYNYRLGSPLNPSEVGLVLW